MSDIPTPIIGLIIAVFVLVFLVIRTRVHALIAMLAAACIAGITGGSYIVLGLSTSNAVNGVVNTLSTRRSGSAVVATTTSDGAGFASTALKYPKALPLVAPFTSAQSGGSAYTWYFGMLRCDV